MTTELGLGLLLALGSAALLNAGYFVQQRTAASLPHLSLGQPLSSLWTLFRAPRWLAGFIAGIVGWALYAAALALAPLSLVQAASAAGIGVLAFLATRFGAARLSKLEWAGIAAACCGLCLLGISLAGQRAAGADAPWPWVAAWIVASLGAAGVIVGVLRELLAPGAALGTAAGLLYAAGDVATKAAVGGGRGLAFVPVLLVCHGLAFIAIQLAFQRGGPMATAGLATLWTNAIPIVAGMAIFGDRLPTGAMGLARLLAFATVVVGAAALSGRGAPSSRGRVGVDARVARTPRAAAPTAGT